MKLESTRELSDIDLCIDLCKKMSARYWIWSKKANYQLIMFYCTVFITAYYDFWVVFTSLNTENVLRKENVAQIKQKVARP